MRRRVFPALIGLLLLVGVAPVSARGSQELPRLLDTMARVATLYADAALEFTCVEQLIDIRFRSQRRQASRESHRFDYFYVFNDDPSEGPVGLQDYRTYYAPEGDGAEGPVRLEPSELGVPAYLTRSYSWVFLFGYALRTSLNFRLEGEDEALDRPAYVVSFRPIDPYPDGVPMWAGRMWIDRESYQLLRVRAARSDAYLARRPVVSERGESFLFIHATVEFGFEKNGLRFPSVATVEGRALVLTPPFEEDYRARVEEVAERGLPYDVFFRVRQEYRDYRFFSVRTEEEVARRLEGIQPD